ncbi:DEAD/DEAH box helicase [Endozoicomonas atrinae]|uniref:DEAD/DEAH box helicase n=1 Tax=Endozoicomonas atrinae TaxID=1333660 RepID=UPI003B0071FB
MLQNERSRSPECAVEAEDIAGIAESYNKLNFSQREAVKHSAEKGLTVIWGPPGTGKTKTLSSFIHAVTKNASYSQKSLNILITGPTYKAVEEIIERTYRLLEGDASTNATLSFGYSASRGSGRLELKSSGNLIYSNFSFERHDLAYQNCLANLFGKTGVHIVGAQIRQARRFSSDLSPLGNNIHETFDVVIIDESSQVPVSHALSALCGLKSNGRLIVAGDNLQMPPITAIHAPEEASYLVGSIQTYLMERDFGFKISSCILDRNYRSASAIVEFAKCIGYPDSLNSEFPHTALNFVDILPDKSQFPSDLPWSDAYESILSPDHSVVALLHEDEVSSQGNQYESRLVAGMVWMLRQVIGLSLNGRGNVSRKRPTADDFWNQCVGIVTPHRAQRALVVRELEKLFPAEAELINEAVDTVERFQGGERHCIIVTYGVADVDVIAGEEAFLMQLERTNVAVSRAMAKCIVVMPQPLAKHIPEDKKTLETAHAIKDYLDEFCNVRVGCEFSDSHETRTAQVRFHN